jgi:tetratricopeptide (TPR) repeat protein
LTVHCLLICAPLAAQRDSLARAFELERRGNYPQATELYRTVLASRPGDVSAVLGLERALSAQNRLPEILPAARAALAANPSATALYGVALRGYAAADQLDSISPLVERWAKAVPGDESPYREWGAVLIQRRDLAGAAKAYQLARERLGKPEVLAPELAQLAVASRDWVTAVREWSLAVRQLPGYHGSAVASLAQTAPAARPEVLRQLEKEPGPEALRLSVELRARWGDPSGAAKALLAALPPTVPQQIDALQQLLEQLRMDSTQASRLAQGMVLEALTGRVNTPSLRARGRLDAARAYAAGGDRESARRMLAAVAGDSATAPGIASGVAVTLIELLVAEGKPREAGEKLDQLRAGLGVDEFLRLRRLVAAGYARDGQIARGESLLEADSSVDALALRGRFQLYQGDLAGATKAFQSAGPVAGTRAEATERSALLALLQPIEADSLPDLGTAFRLLDRGDTAQAAAAFEKLGRSLPPAKGGAALLHLAGRLMAPRSPADAERLLRAAIDSSAPGPAAAASLDLARLLMGLDRKEEAMATLERMILAYPASALLPQARRLLDQARSGVPQT